MLKQSFPAVHSCTDLQFSCMHRPRNQANTDSQQEKLQRPNCKPVCLVPGSVDQDQPVPDCNLQKSLNTHSEGIVPADIGLPTDTTCKVSSTCAVLAFVAGHGHQNCHL
jgi:hypothetical protein